MSFYATLDRLYVHRRAKDFKVFGSYNQLTLKRVGDQDFLICQRTFLHIESNYIDARGIRRTRYTRKETESVPLLRVTPRGVVTILNRHAHQAHHAMYRQVFYMAPGVIRTRLAPRSARATYRERFVLRGGRTVPYTNGVMFNADTGEVLWTPADDERRVVNRKTTPAVKAFAARAMKFVDTLAALDSVSGVLHESTKRVMDNSAHYIRRRVAEISFDTAGMREDQESDAGERAVDALVCDKPWRWMVTQPQTPGEESGWHPPTKHRWEKDGRRRATDLLLDAVRRQNNGYHLRPFDKVR